MPDSNIEIEVETHYHEKESLSKESKYVFSYKICITNHGVDPIKLVSRYWHISDADEKVQEVNGQGVVGQQPRIIGGDSFQYSSGVILDTPAGIMKGHYEFVTDQGDIIEAPIPPFTLANPAHLH